MNIQLSLRNSISLAASAAAIALVCAAPRVSNAQSHPTYSITLSGNASGWSFFRSGGLILTPTVDRYNASRNGVNPFEVGFASGSPATNPQTGAIQFATNSGLLGSGAQIDLVRTSVSGNSLIIDIEGSLSSYSSAIFNSSSGWAAMPWLISGGRIVLNFSADRRTITGEIQISGRGGLYGNATYQATLTGSLVSGNLSSIFGSAPANPTTPTTPSTPTSPSTPNTPGTASGSDDHGNGSATATRLARRVSITGNIGVVGDEDVFRVKVNGLRRGKRPERLVVYTTGDTDTHGTLTGPSGIITTADDSGDDSNFHITRVVRKGTYYIRVRGYDPDSTTGSYTLHVR